MFTPAKQINGKCVWQNLLLLGDALPMDRGEDERPPDAFLTSRLSSAEGLMVRGDEGCERGDGGKGACRAENAKNINGKQLFSNFFTWY